MQVLTYNPIVWIYGYSLISQDKEKFAILQESSRLIANNQEVKVTKAGSLCRKILKNILLPSPVCCFLGFIAGLIPGTEAFYDTDSTLYCIAQAGLNIGLAGVVLGQMSIGGNLILFHSNKLKMTKTYTFSIVLAKNLLMPLCALVLVYGVWQAGIFGDNFVMAYIVFISFCCPTAVIVTVITQLLDYGSQETAWLMFWIYVFASPTLVISTYAFVTIIVDQTLDG